MELICINCPNGCRLKIQKEGDDFKVEGNLCPRGRTYAINELTHPLRTLTTTIHISNGIHAVLPVISDGQLPKDKIKEAIKVLADVEIKAPVSYGDVVYHDILGLGVDIIASRDMESLKKN